MTLTEEQREAIRAVSDLPRAIGCTQCHSYIQEHYGNQFAILRAMIDSSGTVEPAGGFDLERARVEVDTASARRFSESREQARIFCAEEILPDALDEIERLRAENEEALESLTAAYLLGRHEKAQEVAARPKEGKIDSSEHVTDHTKMIGFDLEVRWHDDYMKRFSDITTWHCGHATLWIMHSSGKQEWIPLAAVRRISSVEASQ